VPGTKKSSPRFRGRRDFTHDSGATVGVLLINLGTPDAPTTSAVRRYLAEFLSDPRVVEQPRWFWLPILHGVILQLRPRRSAAAYRTVWTDEGAPLLVIAKRIAGAIEDALEKSLGYPLPVALGMRYGNPSIDEALSALAERGATRIVVLPLYPQYSGSTTGSAFDGVAAALRRWRWVPDIRFISSYHDDASYIAALAESVRAFRAEHGTGDRLLLSFHGIPERYFLAGDPYYCHCQKTGRMLAEALQLDDDHWALSFQSRVGPEAWLRPYTEEVLDTWAREGVARVDVMAPGFAADCLETLEEIADRYGERFAAAGGTLRYIPALNDAETHIEALSARLLPEIRHWGLDAAGGDPAALERLRRAQALGAER
jgi:ferrochelatase